MLRMQICPVQRVLTSGMDTASFNRGYICNTGNNNSMFLLCKQYIPPIYSV
ncbi:hypothetical protein DVU_2264 [Nitratidesulfovibrio vulgaris str. Hildenborough]|uniref:Uncharacterized protein n=1 Tax=Nitratidesulfovibrio vulgaris (strain ATCC 29579 / DSM 644 / CCUG 34227 / NCIMB 8303 / VKM B-1760 / Hildenborough) TaxID=882 RepID=Q729T5_NITV2|nr:hypothetical protein DVU_2264 [Nitratidesulfovibrio vulgaris str. Hildenborough]